MSQLCRLGKNRSVLLVAILFVAAMAAAPRANAQNPTRAVDRAQLLRTPATLRDDEDDDLQLDDTHAVASPNDPDLGEQAILKRADDYDPFTFFASVPISYTSNVALTRTGEEGDVLITPVVGLSYAPRITKTLYGDFGIGQQFFYYDRFPELDFASFDAHAGLTYVLPRVHGLILRANYNFNRLTSGDDLGAEFFTNHGLAFGAELPFRIGRAQQFAVGGDFNFSLASDPDQPARHDLSVYAGYSAALTRAFTIGATARIALREYVDADRTDVSGILAVSASYRITKWLSANAITTLATNDSDRDVFDYDVFNIGGALSLALRY